MGRGQPLCGVSKSYEVVREPGPEDLLMDLLFERRRALRVLFRLDPGRAANRPNWTEFSCFPPFDAIRAVPKKQSP